MAPLLDSEAPQEPPEPAPRPVLSERPNTVGGVKDYAETLRYANETTALIDRALRQERRLQRAYRRLREAELAVEDSRWAPPAYVEARVLLEDELYFLVVALRQVLRGRELMEHLGYPMPEFRQSALVRSWRDIEEHWDDPSKGNDIWAMKLWARESDEEHPGLSLGGADKLRLASGLDMKHVRKDLKAMRRAAGDASEKEWCHCYITNVEAADILGMSVEEFDALTSPPLHLDFEKDGGVRYWREAVEARLQGHTVPPRWVEQGFIQGL
jgi:hypothetical protein